MRVRHARAPLPTMQAAIAFALGHICASATSSASSGGARCVSDMDCNLNGVCQGLSHPARLCTCDAGWTGSTCGVLDVQPVRRAPEAAYSGAIWGGSERSTSSWGGNVVPGPGGSFELFVSEIAGSCGLGAWQQNSMIVHASARNLTGPYSLPADRVMAPFAHNANPVMLSQPPHKGDYAVFHVGSGAAGGTGHGGGRRTDCRNGTTPATPPDAHLAAQRDKVCKPTSNETLPLAKTLAVPHAASPRGPWAFEPQVCVGPRLSAVPAGCPHFSNAAPLILANGSTLLLHSGCPGWQQEGLNLAIAPSWIGPFRPAHGVDSNGTNAWYTPSIHTLSTAHPGGCTDPFMWMDPRGRYHALFHCHWVTGDQVCVSLGPQPCCVCSGFVLICTD